MEVFKSTTSAALAAQSDAGLHGQEALNEQRDFGWAGETEIANTRANAFTSLSITTAAALAAQNDAGLHGQEALNDDVNPTLAGQARSKSPTRVREHLQSFNDHRSCTRCAK